MTEIDGECVGANAYARVRISRLAPAGCRVRPMAAGAPLDGELDLWIGAMGPFPIVALRGRGGGFIASFKQPLEPAIVAHFRA